MLDLQARGKLTSLSWVDTCTGPRNQSVWTSTCKGVLRVGIIDDSRPSLPSSTFLVAGKVVAVGTGTHKHVARNVAATDALEVLKAEEQE